MRTFAALLLVVVSSTASVAQALTLEISPGVTVEMAEPSGLCALNPGAHAADRQAFNQMVALQSGINKVLVFMAECPALEAARAGTNAALQRWVIVLAQMREGQLRPIEDMTRKAYLEGLRPHVGRGQGGVAVEGDIRERVRQAFRDGNTSVAMQRTLGELASDEYSFYTGLVTLNRVAGKETQVAAVTGYTMIKNYPVTINLYKPFVQPTDFETLVGEARLMMADLIARNDPPSKSGGGFNWEKLGGSIMLGVLVGLGVAIVAIVVAWNKKRRSRRPLG